ICSRQIPGVTQIDLGAQIVWLIGQYPRAGAIRLGETLFVVNELWQPLFSIVTLVKHDPVLQVIGDLIFVFWILLQVIPGGLIGNSWVRNTIIHKPFVHIYLCLIVGFLSISYGTEPWY